MRRLVEYMLRPLENRMAVVALRGWVTRVTDVGRTLQVKILEGIPQDHVRRYQEYGFASHPRPGAEVVGVSLGGLRERFVVVTVDDPRSRAFDPPLAEGEVALYADSGARVVLRTNGIVQVVAPNYLDVYAPVILSHGEMRISGDLIVSGSITASGSVADGGGSMSAMRGTYDIHVHPAGTPNTGAPVPLMGG